MGREGFCTCGGEGEGSGLHGIVGRTVFEMNPDVALAGQSARLAMLEIAVRVRTLFRARRRTRLRCSNDRHANGDQSELPQGSAKVAVA